MLALLTWSVCVCVCVCVVWKADAHTVALMAECVVLFSFKGILSEINVRLFACSIINYLRAWDSPLKPSYLTLQISSNDLEQPFKGPLSALHMVTARLNCLWCGVQLFFFLIFFKPKRPAFIKGESLLKSASNWHWIIEWCLDKVNWGED